VVCRTLSFQGVIVASTLLLCAACGSRQSTSDQRPIQSERQQACDTFLSEAGALNTSEASEEQLSQAMERADADAEICMRLYLESAETEATRALAVHRGREFTLVALNMEAALSYYFDDRNHYCEIIRETFTLMLQNVADLELALTTPGLAESEEGRQLAELRDLDLEAMDVLYEATDSFCSL
jgi:uncharacterized protein YcfL